MRKHTLAALLPLLLSLLTLCILPVFAEDTSASTEVPDGRIHYIALDTTIACDSFLIESNGEYMLVDTGNPDPPTGGVWVNFNNKGNVQAVIAYLRSLGIESLDYLVMTHNHSDHIGGVQRLCEAGLVDRHTKVYYRTGASTAEDEDNASWGNLYYLRTALDALSKSHAQVTCLADEGITELSLQVGAFTVDFLNLDLDQDGVVDFCYENENNNSLVLKVSCGEIDTLLTADIEDDEEARLLEALELGGIEVLKAPHHGSTTSSSFAFLSTLQPETAVVTSFRYRQGGAYEYLQVIGTEIYTTELCTADAIVQNVWQGRYTLDNAELYLADGNDGWLGWFDDFMYLDGGRPILNDWLQDGRSRYYFDENGLMVTGLTELDGKTYYFNEDGTMATGWHEVDGKWLQFLPSGEQAPAAWQLSVPRPGQAPGQAPGQTPGQAMGQAPGQAPTPAPFMPPRPQPQS